MLIDLFIIVLLIWFWCWDLPRDLPTRKFVGFVQKPFLWLGLWHNWAMFAPDPIRVNRRLKAIITYSEGSVDEWRPIEPGRSNWFLDLLWFRHFKYQFSVLSGANKVLWKPLCDWLCQQAALDGQTVTSIQLVREYQVVQSPTSDQPLSEWQSAVMYEQSMLEQRP
jgi:hypothetical protein